MQITPFPTLLWKRKGGFEPTVGCRCRLELAPKSPAYLTPPSVHTIFESFLAAGCPKPIGFPRKNGRQGVKPFGHGKSSIPRKRLKYSVNAHRCTFAEYLSTFGVSNVQKLGLGAKRSADWALCRQSTPAVTIRDLLQASGVVPPPLFRPTCSASLRQTRSGVSSAISPATWRRCQGRFNSMAELFSPTRSARPRRPGAGIRGISVPCGFAKVNGSQLPIGLQILGKALDEARLFQVAHAYEQSTDWYKARPKI